MTDKRAYAYFDDDKDIVNGFKRAVKQVWCLDHDVLSNTTFERIDDSNYEQFETEICEKVGDNVDRLECVFLDLDFSKNAKMDAAEEARDLVGFMLGRAIRRRWPQLPIIVVSRFTEKAIIRKGLIFDFDDVRDAIELMQMDLAGFSGVVEAAKRKRLNVIQSVGDVPVSFLTGNHKYFRRVASRLTSRKFAFVAMPFNKEIVPEDIWNYGISGPLRELSIEAIRVDMDLGSRAIMDKVATFIFDSAFVIADLTGWNANVLYELGLAHASNKVCVLIYNKSAEDELPFDIQHLPAIQYSSNNIKKLSDDLKEAIQYSLETTEDT